MLTIKLTAEVRQKLITALRDAGNHEIGGVLMAEHTDQNYFTVLDLTIHRRGTLASFVRRIGYAIKGIRQFFKKTGEHYTKYNYLGEWHSHPNFSTEPSARDDASMIQIVQDTEVGATFVVLLVVRLDLGEITGSAHTYLPDGTKHQSVLLL